MRTPLWSYYYKTLFKCHDNGRLTRLSISTLREMSRFCWRCEWKDCRVFLKGFCVFVCQWHPLQVLSQVVIPVTGVTFARWHVAVWELSYTKEFWSALCILKLEKFFSDSPKTSTCGHNCGSHQPQLFCFLLFDHMGTVICPLEIGPRKEPHRLVAITFFCWAI